jgi:polyisoprenoid-binding protein YceI
MTLPIAPGTYGIDTMHSQLGFSVSHLGISLVRGTFDAYTGSLTVGDGLGATELSIDAQMASVHTGNEKRDAHLHGEDFFDVANHPQMSFRSTGIDKAGSAYTLTGDLTIRGVTRSVTLAAAYNGSGVFPMDKSTHYGFSASGTISRSEFGVTYGVPLASDDVALMLEAQFVSPASD